ncbi:MAG: transcription antitermination factor NusB [Xanthomonadales bacterium]|nr:Transcription antitermination protein NusB [Xanthomonadales bacterium]MCC6592925.1 transcription antitermination factor NusB [Xanthomonadales bacterium]MCE7930465.1 transcription antitermination factor NusB [Xanthomonadales bacterium PRO6]
MKPTRPFPERARARRRALQALYQWQIGGGPMRRIIEQFNEEQDMAIADGAYFSELLLGVEAQLAQIDGAIAPCADRGIDEIDAIERATLRLATFELLHRLDIPYKVVINEAIELARDFGAEGGHGYVNAVLDRVARNARTAETR